jgi:CxxC-x17-CxxC domain-containing protein
MAFLYLTKPKKGGGSMGYQGGGGFGGGFGGPREMHKATCAECKKECEVPFKPREDRPVYCKDCFSKRKDSGR